MRYLTIPIVAGFILVFFLMAIVGLVDKKAVFGILDKGMRS